MVKSRVGIDQLGRAFFLVMFPSAFGINLTVEFQILQRIGIGKRKFQIEETEIRIGCQIAVRKSVKRFAVFLFDAFLIIAVVVLFNKTV